MDVFFKDVYKYLDNQVNVCLYLVNNTEDTIINPFCYYYFKTEENKTPIYNDWWTPNCTGELEQITAEYWRVKITFDNTSVLPGGNAPMYDNVSVGLHYSNWSTFNKSNDPSYMNTEEFLLNMSIPVYDENGKIMGGVEPDLEDFTPLTDLSSVKVYFKESDNNTDFSSLINLYIENNGNETITGFYCYYYFQIENNKTPVISPVFTSGCNISLEYVNTNIYRIKFDLLNYQLYPGAKIPETEGFSVRIHYSDWSQYDKVNDISNSLSSEFVTLGCKNIY